MSDLYDRLEEIQGMTRVLAGDVQRLGRQLGDRSIQSEVSDEQAGARRAYIRAIFALIEAIVEQHKRLLLDLSTSQFVTLAPGVAYVLTEQGYVVDENGTVTLRDQYLQLRRKLRAVYRAAAEAFAKPLRIEYGDNGWRLFGNAVKVRDRITHPMSFADCQISGEDLDTVDAANDWFKGVNSEFVRVAREHRKERGW